MQNAPGIEREGLLVEAVSPRGEQEIPPEVLERIDQITQTTAEEIRIALAYSNSEQKTLALRQFQIRKTARIERKTLREAIESSGNKTKSAVFVSNVEKSLIRDGIILEKKGPQGKGKTTEQVDTQILTLRSGRFTVTDQIPKELKDFHKRTKTAIDSIEDTEIKSLLLKLAGKYLGEAMTIDSQLLEKANEELKKIGIFIDQRRGIAILRPLNKNQLPLPTSAGLATIEETTAAPSGPVHPDFVDILIKNSSAFDDDDIFDVVKCLAEAADSGKTEGYTVEKIAEETKLENELVAIILEDSKDLENLNAKLAKFGLKIVKYKEPVRYALKRIEGEVDSDAVSTRTAAPAKGSAPAAVPAPAAARPAPPLRRPEPLRISTEEELNRFIMNSLIQGMNGSEISVKAVNDLIEALQGGIYDPAVKKLADKYLAKLRSARAAANKGRITNRHTNILLGGV